MNNNSFSASNSSSSVTSTNIRYYKKYSKDYDVTHYNKSLNSVCCIFITVLILLAILFAILFTSGTDHDGYDDDDGHNHHKHCSKDNKRPHYLPKFRPIESSEYGTGTNTPYSRGIKQFTGWKETPKPKDISNEICDQNIDYSDIPPHQPLTNFFWVHGQFLVHTNALQINNEEVPRIFQDPPRFIGIHPSISIVDNKGNIQQINHLSPYLDLSVIYGSDNEVAYFLRKNDGSGKLKMSTSPYHNEKLLFINPEDDQYISGDIRVRENVLLTSYHTLWNREHNWWCDKLKNEHHDWDGDKIYNTARHIVTGEFQSIIYNEWLPILLGTPDLFGKKACYNPKCSATIRNEAATAALRLGHTLVTQVLYARNINSPTCDIIPGRSLTLMEAFNQDSIGGSIWKYGIDTYLLGALKQQSEQYDPRVNDDLRENIFDLASMNLARGRDHELPSYQQLFERIKNKPFTNLNQLTSSQILQDRLIRIYGKHNHYPDGYRDYVENHYESQDHKRCDYFKPLDPWVSFISEKSLPGALMGEIGARIVMEQFNTLRNCDPYFYLWDDVVDQYRHEIHNTRLSTLLKRNTNIDPSQIRQNAFKFY